MEALERLSVVSRITTELHNHWGLQDRDLAEFIVHLGEEASSLEDFSSQLKENGASVSSSLAVSLYTTIQKLSSKKKKEKASSSSSSSFSSSSNAGGSSLASSREDGASFLEEKKDINRAGERGGQQASSFLLSLVSREKGEKDDFLREKEKKFPGLCRPNDVSRPELFLERPAEDAPLSSHAQKLLEAEKDEKELMKEQKEALRKSQFHPHRSNAAGRQERLSDGKTNSASRDEERRNSPPSEKEGKDNKPPAHYYGSSGPMIRYAIYEGVVEKVLEFGCFVRLQFTDAGTRQGLLHVVDMTPTKLQNAAGGGGGENQRPRQPQ